MVKQPDFWSQNRGNQPRENCHDSANARAMFELVAAKPYRENGAFAGIRLANHRHIHVRGYKEEGAIPTPFDMTVMNELDRFHLVMDALDRLPQTGGQGVHLKQQLKDQLVEHKRYICKHGQDLPEVRNCVGGFRAHARSAVMTTVCTSV